MEERSSNKNLRETYESDEDYNDLAFSSENKINNSKFKDKKSKKNNIIENKKFPVNPKQRLLLREIIIFLSLILIPAQAILNKSLAKIERKSLFFHLEKLVSYKTVDSKPLLNLFHFFGIFVNIDFISCCCCIFFTVFHPFIALKITYSINIFHYFLVLLECFNQSKRPSWETWPTDGEDSSFRNKIIECDASFSNPSESLFNFIFFYIYSLFSYKKFYNSNEEHLDNALKIILLIIFICFISMEYCLMLLYKLHYLNEMVFTTVLTLILICVVVDLENKLHFMIFKSTKNLFKTRKNKVKYFLYIFGLLILAILTFNFCAPKYSLYSMEKKIEINESCSRYQKEEIGIKNTFMKITYIFNILGIFWGSALTIENNPGIWWYQPSNFDINQRTISGNILEQNNANNNRNSIEEKSLSPLERFLLLFKGILTGIIYWILWLGFNYIPYITFEFNFVINCLKNFILFFICTGILPIIYGYLKLNHEPDNFIIKIRNELGDDKIINNTKGKNLFEPTLFVECYNKPKTSLLSLDIHGTSGDIINNQNALVRPSICTQGKNEDY